MERLSALKDGCKAYVVSVDAPNIQKIRLNDLGFLKGESVERLYASPLGSPVVYRVMGREVALRRSEARCVVVSTEKTVCAADECEEKLLTSTMRHPFHARVCASLDFLMFSSGLGCSGCRKEA